MTVVDLFTSYLIGVALTGQSAEVVAEASLRYVFPFGAPRMLLSDRGQSGLMPHGTK